MTDDKTATRRLLRILAVVLTVLWAGISIAVASAYRPGGPVDVLVALACFTPVLVADAGIVWPAAPRSHRSRVALVWVWIAATLFSIPVLYDIAIGLAAEGHRSLLPSLEAAYAGAIAVFAMAYFSIVGRVHARRDTEVFERRSSWLAAGLALLLTGAISVAFVFVAAVNQRTLQADEPTVSSFGPTDADLVPPFCDEPLRLGAHATVTIEAVSRIDGVERAQASLRGLRSGDDEAWGGAWARPEGDGQQAYRRVGPQAWVNERSGDPDAPGTTWQQTEPNPFALAGADGLTMDGPPHAIVNVPRGRIVPEDLGLEVIDGARARHCRTFMDGPMALDAFLPLRWLLAGGSTDMPGAISQWRGEMDWWVFGDGELGVATVEVSGPQTGAPWEAAGVRAALEARLEAVDRDRPVDITAPGAATEPQDRDPTWAPTPLPPSPSPHATAGPTLGSGSP